MRNIEGYAKKTAVALTAAAALVGSFAVGNKIGSDGISSELTPQITALEDQGSQLEAKNTSLAQEMCAAYGQGIVDDAMAFAWLLNVHANRSPQAGGDAADILDEVTQDGDAISVESSGSVVHPADEGTYEAYHSNGVTVTPANNGSMEIAFSGMGEAEWIEDDGSRTYAGSNGETVTVLVRDVSERLQDDLATAAEKKSFQKTIDTIQGILHEAEDTGEDDARSGPTLVSYEYSDMEGLVKLSANDCATNPDIRAELAHVATHPSLATSLQDALKIDA